MISSANNDVTSLASLYSTGVRRKRLMMTYRTPRSWKTPLQCALAVGVGITAGTSVLATSRYFLDTETPLNDDETVLCANSPEPKRKEAPKYYSSAPVTEKRKFWEQRKNVSGQIANTRDALSGEEQRKLTKEQLAPVEAVLRNPPLQRRTSSDTSVIEEASERPPSIVRSTSPSPKRGFFRRLRNRLGRIFSPFVRCVRRKRSPQNEIDEAYRPQADIKRPDSESNRSSPVPSERDDALRPLSSDSEAFMRTEPGRNWRFSQRSSDGSVTYATIIHPYSPTTKNNQEPSSPVSTDGHDLVYAELSFPHHSPAAIVEQPSEDPQAIVEQPNEDPQGYSSDLPNEDAVYATVRRVDGQKVTVRERLASS